jgi:hypothetical protein
MVLITLTTGQSENRTPRRAGTQIRSDTYGPDRGDTPRSATNHAGPGSGRVPAGSSTWRLASGPPQAATTRIIQVPTGAKASIARERSKAAMALSTTRSPC